MQRANTHGDMLHVELTLRPTATDHQIEENVLSPIFKGRMHMASCFSISPLEPNLWKGINQYHYTIIIFVLPCGMCTLSSVGRCTPDSRGRCYWVQNIFVQTHVCTPSTSIRPSSYSPEYILIQFDIFSFHQTIIFIVQLNFVSKSIIGH